MYTDHLSRVTNPVTGESKLLGLVGARAQLGDYKHMYERVLAKLERDGEPKNAVQERCVARLWDMAFKYEGWIQALETYLSGGEA